MNTQDILQTRWGRFLLGGGVVFIFLVSVIFMMETITSRAQLYLVEQTPVENYFNYEGIEYVGRENDSLIFASTSIVRESYPMFWNDILRCGPDEEMFRFYSVQNTDSASPLTRTEYRELEWNYNKPFPVGQTCYIDSTISMDVKGIIKSQSLESPRFVVE